MKGGLNRAADARVDLASLQAGGQVDRQAALIRALCIETHENWLEAHRYRNMDYLRELK